MSYRHEGLQVVAIAAALLLSACAGNNAPVGPEQHESRSVDLDKSETVRMQLKMPVGELIVRGGAQKLLNADFTYSLPASKPNLRYSSVGSSGDLVIEQHGPSTSGGNAKNRWELRFNENVPLNFRAELGAGEARLELGRLSLRSVNVTMGAGTLDLDLRGAPVYDYSVRVQGGIGEATVHLPRDVGISAAASGGLGDISVSGLRKSGDRYANDAYARAGRRVRLDIEGGIGSIKLIAE